jgi:hypothetical protein
MVVIAEIPMELNRLPMDLWLHYKPHPTNIFNLQYIELLMAFQYLVIIKRMSCFVVPRDFASLSLLNFQGGCSSYYCTWDCILSIIKLGFIVNKRWMLSIVLLTVAFTSWKRFPIAPQYFLKVVIAKLPMGLNRSPMDLRLHYSPHQTNIFDLHDNKLLMVFQCLVIIKQMSCVVVPWDLVSSSLLNFQGGCSSYFCTWDCILSII